MTVEAFESVIGSILSRNGYWVKYSFKVKLTKDDKRRINRPSCPNWDLDIVAHKPAHEEVLIVECKSYLGSPGVRFKSITRQDHSWSKNFKLFNQPRLRNVISKRLLKQLVDNGSCLPKSRVRLCLAAGRVVVRDRAEILRHFKRRGWELFDREWIANGLGGMTSEKSYENDVAVIVAKLLAPKGKRLLE
jgi:hypothetical protein